MFRGFSHCVINLSHQHHICCGLKKCSALIGWFAWCGSKMAVFVVWQVVSLKKNEQQRQSLLLKVDPRSTFSQRLLQPATNVFAAQQIDHARSKTRNVDPKLTTKQCCATSFCISYFAALEELAETWHKRNQETSLTGGKCEIIITIQMLHALYNNLSMYK